MRIKCRVRIDKVDGGYVLKGRRGAGPGFQRRKWIATNISDATKTAAAFLTYDERTRKDRGRR
jgi:hypothetical protein